MKNELNVKIRRSVGWLVMLCVIGFLNYLAYSLVGEITIPYIMFAATMSIVIGLFFWFYFLMRDAAMRD